MLHLADNIRLIRLLSEKTQPEFGEKFGATKAMIVSYENGKANPSELFLSRVSKYSGVEIEDLKNKRLTENDIKIKGEKGEKGELKNSIDVGKSNEQSDDTIQKLIADNSAMIRAMEIDARAREQDAIARKIDADVRKSLTKSNEELVRMVRKTTEGAPQQNEQDLSSIREAVVEFLIEVASGKRYKDRESAGQAYSKKVAELMALKQEKDTQKNSGKMHSVK